MGPRLNEKNVKATAPFLTCIHSILVVKYRMVNENKGEMYVLHQCKL